MKSFYIEFTLVLFIWLSIMVPAQNREYNIHDRGMLHQTVYNTGELGRAWMTGTEGNETSLPLMEWPSRSQVLLDGILYSGQHNSLGAGVHIAANLDSLPGSSERLFAFCGAVGSSTPEVCFGRWSFPYYLARIDNYPLLEDGSLNLKYFSTDAEQIIEGKWGTSLGISCKRTSRAWSYPDYDDFIIYEYEFVYNGDLDGNPATIEQTKTLKDVQFCFVYGFGPSMYGYQRHYNVWKYDGGLYKGDQDMFFDSDYWLTFNMDRQRDSDFGLGGKPEPDSAKFMQFAKNKENGGGLCSPQAPGFCILHYDTTHLAIVNKDSLDTINKNESEYAAICQPHEIDANYRIKQPWSDRIQTGDINSTKQATEELLATTRKSTPLGPTGTTPPLKYPFETSAKQQAYKTYWAGRSPHQYSNTTFGIRKNFQFGPYTMHFGDTIRFAIAEVVGYGADSTKIVEGGRDTNNTGAKYRWNRAPGWARPVYSFSNGKKVKVSNNYLKEFGYPDYVNSNVRNVMQVAHKAFEAYTGLDEAALKVKLPVHPEELPSRGVYKNVKIPCPAPVIRVIPTDSGNVIITWNRNAEFFSPPNLMGVLKKYKVMRSVSGMGPWKTIAIVDAGGAALNNLGNYEVNDPDPSFRIGTAAYYSVISIDDKGNESGKTNILHFRKNLESVKKMGKVYAVPNPFIIKSGFDQEDDKIAFFGLPEKCTIRIFSFAGNLVETLEHDERVFTHDWFQVSKAGQEIASGIYFYVVTTPSGEKYTGKFVVIK